MSVRIRMVALTFGFIAFALPTWAQDWKGAGRFEGRVLDEEGKPIAGATIKARLPQRGGGPDVKTDKKGWWAVAAVFVGTWELDVEAPGYETRQISVNLPSESARLKPIEVRLEKAKKTGPSAELAAAAQAADDAYKAGRFAEARAEYEKVLAARPDLAALVHQQIGFCFIQEKNPQKAVEHLEMAIAADPANQKLRAIAVQAALEGNLIDKARELLTTLDESVIDNADIFFNMGGNFFNAGLVEESIVYFGKAIAKDPTHVEAYYRRALAYFGQGKMAEARADFQKVVELNGDKTMTDMAKKALDQIK